MCEICKVELGEIENMACDNVEFKVGKRNLEDQLLVVAIRHNDDDTYSLISSYFMDDGDPIAEIKLPITYCPFCGKELPHGNETRYPWSLNGEKET